MGFTFGASGGQKVTKMSPTNDAKFGMKALSWLVGRRGVSGEVNLPAGGYEEKKKGRMGGRKENSKI